MVAEKGRFGRFSTSVLFAPGPFLLTATVVSAPQGGYIPDSWDGPAGRSPWRRGRPLPARTYWDGQMTEESSRTRRRFLKIASASLGGVMGAVLAIPLLESVVTPALRGRKSHFSRLARLGDLPTGTPVDRTFADRVSDAFIQETVLRDVWVVKHGPSNVDVFSPICPHLGCRFDWHSGREQFLCPCHGSVFSPTGEVVGGPAPRPLDTLPTRIEGDEIYVEWERFKVGISEKVAV